MLSGWGKNIVWYSPIEQPKTIAKPPQPAETLPVLLQTYKQIWTQPLFNQDRTADILNSEMKNEVSAPQLAGFILIGVVISPHLHKAFFKTPDGKNLNVNEGDALQNGWVVESIEHGKVTLSYRSTKQEMILPVLKIPAGSVL